jgi:hypothetical protein
VVLITVALLVTSAVLLITWFIIVPYIAQRYANKAALTLHRVSLSNITSDSVDVMINATLFITQIPFSSWLEAGKLTTLYEGTAMGIMSTKRLGISSGVKNPLVVIHGSAMVTNAESFIAMGKAVVNGRSISCTVVGTATVGVQFLGLSLHIPRGIRLNATVVLPPAKSPLAVTNVSFDVFAPTPDVYPTININASLFVPGTIDITLPNSILLSFSSGETLMGTGVPHCAVLFGNQNNSVHITGELRPTNPTVADNALGEYIAGSTTQIYIDAVTAPILVKQLLREMHMHTALNGAERCVVVQMLVGTQNWGFIMKHLLLDHHVVIIGRVAAWNPFSGNITLRSLSLNLSCKGINVGFIHQKMNATIQPKGIALLNEEIAMHFFIHPDLYHSEAITLLQLVQTGIALADFNGVIQFQIGQFVSSPFANVSHVPICPFNKKGVAMCANYTGFTPPNTTLPSNI